MYDKLTHEVLRQVAPRLLTVGQITRLTDARYDTVGKWTEADDFPAVAISLSDLRGTGVRAWIDEEVLDWLENSGDNGRHWARRKAASVWRSKIAEGR